MKQIRYCPNCVTEMVKERRGLGRRSKESFYVCPMCGVREEASEPQDSLIIKTNDDGRQSSDNDDVTGEFTFD